MVQKHYPQVDIRSAVHPQNDLPYLLALTLVPTIGDVHAKILLRHFGEAQNIFRARLRDLEAVEGIGTIRARAIKSFDDFATAEREILFAERYKLRILTLSDADYPQRLLQCYDPPTVLFYRGEATLNGSRMLAVVGTRSASDYGKTFTDKLVHDLRGHGVTIVSGLAYGIDAAAHRASLKHGLPTIGVVAHGLDKVYPHEHTAMAKEMIGSGGGLLTEFFSGTKPDKHNFPLRNRIVAGITDATIVVESSPKGGSIITAKLADAYNRDVFAVPGRTTDKGSTGCNGLIRQNKAFMLTDATELFPVLGWEVQKPKAKKQRELFIELSPEDQKMVDLLNGTDGLPIDEINLRSGLSSSGVAAALLNLELQGIVQSLPGKVYRMV